MPIASFFRCVAHPLRHVFAASLAFATAAFAQSPSAADGFDPNVDGNVYALAAQADGRLILGGQFGTLHPGIGVAASRTNLARVNPDGSADLSFDPGANGPVRSVVLQADGKILVGGDFTAIAGGARNRLARLNADGSLDTAFNPNVGGTAAAVYAIVVQPDGRIVIGGSFTNVGGVTRNRLARLSAAGVLEPAFDPNANNIVFALALHGGGKILAGGAFTTIGTTPRQRMVRLNPDGTVDSEFDTMANNSVYAIAVQRDGRILLGGAFTTVQPYPTPVAQPRAHLARLQADGQFDSLFNGNVSGDVNALAVHPDGSILVGGTFTSAWAAGSAPTGRGFIARFSAGGSLDTVFTPFANQAVTSFAFFPDGRLAIGGYFTRVATRTAVTGVPRNRVARLATDGSLDASFALEDGGRPLVTATQSDGKILLAGTFTSVGGVTRDFLARLNADGTLDTAFNPIPNGRVSSIAVQADGKILIGGLFTTIGGTARNYFARLNANGTLDTAFDPNANAEIGVIVVQSDGKILIGGVFTALVPTTTTTTTSTPSVANSTTTTTNTNGSTTTVTVTTVSGTTTTVTTNNFPRGHIARLNTDGSPDTTFNPDANNNVYAIVIQSDGKLLLGGSFTTFQPNPTTNATATTRQGLARLNADGTLDNTYKPSPNGSVSAIALQSDGKAIVGGSFGFFPIPNVAANATVTTTARNRLARVNTDGTIDTPFDPNANGNVQTIALQSDGKILVGGQFTTLQPNGAADWTLRKYAARLNADGTLDTTFNLDLDERVGNNVTSLRVQSDGKILMCGGFLSLQPIGATARITRGHFVRLNAAGTLDTAFNPAAGGPASGTINAFAVQPDGRILVGGVFSDLGGTTTTNIARFNPEGTLDASLPRATGADGAINAIALRPNTSGLVPQGPGFAWLDATGALRNFRLGSDVVLSGQVTSFAFQSDGKLLLGGSFSNLAGATANNLVRINADGSLDASFNPNPNGPVDAISIQNDGRILIAGGFTLIANTTRNRVARLKTDGSLEAFDPNANGRVSTIIEQPNGQILLAGQFTTLQPNSFTTSTTTTATSTANDKNSTNTTTNADGSTTTTAVTVANGTTTTTVTTVSGSAVTRNYIARVGTDGNLDANFAPSLSGPVNALVIQADGKIVFGGLFNTVTTTTTTTTTSTPNAGSSSTTTNNANGTTTTVTISTTSGTTTTSTTLATPRNYVARVNGTDGTVDTAYDPNPNAGVNALAIQPDGKVVIGGAFTALGTTVRYNIGRINTDGGTDAGFDPNANGPVTAIAVQPDGGILLAGGFTTLQPPGTAALTRNGLARLTAAGALDANFDPNPNGLVLSFGGRSDGSVVLAGNFTALQPGGVMYVGGAFNNLGGITVRGLVALNNDGSANSSFAPNPNGDVTALLVQADGKLVVGGTFTNIAGATRNRLARFNPDGSLDAAFSSSVFGAVGSLARQSDGKILVVGTPAGGGAALIARLNTDATRDASFNSSAAVSASGNLAVQPDGRILVVTTQPSIQRLNADGSIDNTFATAVFDGAIRVMVLQADGRVLVGGAFTTVAGTATPRVARLNTNGSVDATFAPAPDAAVTAIAIQADGRVLLGGAFKNVGALTRSAIARVSAAGTAVQSLAFSAGGSGAQRNIAWVRDGTGPELSSASFDVSGDARTWTTLAASGTRPTGGRGWQTGVVTVPVDAPFYVRARGLVASGTGTSGVVEFVQQFNLSSSSTLAGTAGANVAASAVANSKTGEALFVQTSSAGSGDFVAGATAAAVADPVVLPGTTIPGTVVVTNATSRLVNLSVRARVTTATPLLTGFAISGTGSRTVLLRGVGPSLGVFGVTGPLAQPVLRLYDTGGNLLIENNGWAATPANVAEVGAAMIRTGAFPFAANSGNDTAVAVTLAPGTYTMQVLDRTGTGGIALAEVYDADSSTTSRLVNLSTRSSVTAAEGAFISGFVISGGSKNLLVRGLGPALGKFNVTGTLADPMVSVYDSQGRAITTNDNWSNATADGFLNAATAALSALSAQVSAFPLDLGSNDAALSITLGPGAYTVQVNGPTAAATGAAMIEIYELP